MKLIGAHTIDTGGLDMAARRAAGAGMRALQIFTAIPKYYGEKTSIRPERVSRFTAALAETGIDPAHVISHAAYVLNTATPDGEKWPRARNGLTKELERATALGIGGVCFHPGAATGGDRAEGLRRVAAAMTFALESVPGRTRLYIENTAGAGMTVGRTPDEIAGILTLLPTALRARAGYGLDTCHLFAAGHNIAASRAQLTTILDDFEQATGAPPAFFHLNDSDGELGSNRDRHRLIGEGRIGVEAFGWLLRDPRTSGVPLVLETPQQNPDVAEDDATPDPYDAAMIRLLESFS